MATFSEIKAKALAEWQAFEQDNPPHVLVGAATCGKAAGALDTVRHSKSNKRSTGLTWQSLRSAASAYATWNQW